jgi:hypothetical protein
MIGHQLFKVHNKISERVLTLFWMPLQLLLFTSSNAKNGGLLSINSIYVATKINISHKIDNQLVIHNIEKRFDFLKTGFLLKRRVVNKYQLTNLEWVDSEDNYLFLPPSPPLNRKRYQLFSLPSSMEVGNLCICTHQEIQVE